MVATIISQGCTTVCGHCRTHFSFSPSEAQHSTRQVPAGYSPEEEAYDESVFTVACPNCKGGVNVGNKLGPLAKKELQNRPKMFPDHDI